MNLIKPTKINGYLDNALETAGWQSTSIMTKKDSESSAILFQYRQQIEELHRLYDSILTEPLPQRMLDLLKPKACLTSEKSTDTDKKKS